MRLVPLADARDESELGGKAVQLGVALRAGLSVPNGVVLPVDLVRAVVERVPSALAIAAGAYAGAPRAVRSSAIGEDGTMASFAGQHLTLLNVGGADEVLHAVRRVWESARVPAALEYRRRLGLPETARMAVVVQDMVAVECAGVLFTRNPVTGADELLVEVSWGLGEAVVAGLVTPDRMRLDRAGRVLQATTGNKDVEVVAAGAGGTSQRPVEPDRARAPCLEGGRCRRLAELAAACERAFPGTGAHDLEFAFDVAGALHLLQRRIVTGGR